MVSVKEIMDLAKAIQIAEVISVELTGFFNDIKDANNQMSLIVI